MHEIYPHFILLSEQYTDRKIKNHDWKKKNADTAAFQLPKPLVYILSRVYFAESTVHWQKN